MSSGAAQLSVIVPAYNESSRIVPTLTALCECLPQIVDTWEVRVVDDGSTDDTAEKVRAVAATKEQVILQCEPHRGKGAAVRAGMLAATAALRFMCDADLSMPVAEIARFRAVVPRECDVAIGSREGTGAHRVGEPEHRHVMGRIFNQLVKRAIGLRVDDTQCGFKMFTAEAAELIFPQLTLDGWAFDIEALFIAERAGLRVCEVPIEWRYNEQSHVSPLRDSYRMARDVFRIRANAARGRYT